MTDLHPSLQLSTGQSLRLSKRDRRVIYAKERPAQERKRWTAGPVTDRLTPAGRKHAAAEAARRVRRKIRRAQESA